jgi:hypothetical protein
MIVDLSQMIGSATGCSRENYEVDVPPLEPVQSLVVRADDGTVVVAGQNLNSVKFQGFDRCSTLATP